MTADETFEQAVNIGFSQLRDTRDKIEYSLVEQLKFLSKSNDPKVFMDKDLIKTVVTNVWGLIWDDPQDNLNHKKCDCGAKHKWAPDHHSDWCSVLNPNRSDNQRMSLGFVGIGTR